MVETVGIIDTEVAKAKQGKVTGIIVPPPEIRAVADKTAQFVARNGKSFEQRILASEEGKTAKFNFMKAFDPYHAYYEFKIREFEEGGGANASTVPSTTAAPASVKEEVQSTEPAKVAPAGDDKPAAGTTKSSTTTAARATIMSPIARFAKAKPENPPPEYEFSLGQPSGVSPLDMDVIKLTAQFTAANGREFLAGLAQREMRNPQFDFLKPTHLLFSYFTSLVDAYAKVLAPSEEQSSRLKKLSDKMAALELSVQRWVYTKDEAERKYKESTAANADKIAFNSIDWHDFVVVETVDFPVDEVFEYPAAHLLGSTGASGARASSSLAASHGYGDDEDMDMDTGDDNAAPPPPPPPVLGLDVDMEDDSEMKVVTDYRPRMAAGAAKSVMTMADPLTGRMLPVNAMEEHMRVALLDPKWRVEQQRFQDKQRETGYAEGGSIADSLKQFARRRGDIFGNKKAGVQSGTEDSQGGEENDDDDSKLKSETVQWDGRASSLPAMQQLQHQMAAAASYSTAPPPPPPGSSIGPTMPATNTALAFSLPPPPGPPGPPAGFMAPHFPPPLIPPVAPVMGIPAPYMPPATMPFLPPPPPPAFAIPGAVPSGFAPSLIQAAPSISSQDPPKKPRTEAVEVLSAEDFCGRFPGDYTVSVTAPQDASAQGLNWGLQGQTITISVNALLDVRSFKDIVSQQVRSTGHGTENLPVNRFQLKLLSNAVFLKDANTLAIHNVGPDSKLEINLKSRR